jgi:DNA-binding transcriptional regulator YhcF (GntR family)
MVTGIDPLPLPVTRDDEIPVGLQLAWRLRALIATGRLTSGDKLPGVRELAQQVGVNVNTARAVYARLENDGLLASRRGLGTFVADHVETSPAIERLASAALDGARAADVDPRELVRAIYASGWSAEGGDTELIGGGTGLPDVGPAADEAAARRELRRQIGRLERQLASYPEASANAKATHPLLRPKGHVAGVGELEAIRDELMSRLKQARDEAEGRGQRQSRARGRRERVIGDPEAHRWQRVTNDDVGDPGCAEIRSVPRFGPIGAVAGWWRVKLSSGCP